MREPTLPLRLFSYTIKKVRPHRRNITLATMAVFWLAGSILLLSASLVAISQQHSDSLASGGRLLATAPHHVRPTPTVQPSPTPSQAPSPTPTPSPSPSPTPTPLPITPFPSALQQEVGALMAQGRFFYNGNVQLPEIALTFDDGPNPPYTSQILSILHQYGVKASFFCVGRQAAAYPNLVAQEQAAGHVIGNHSWAHPDLTRLSPTSITWQLSTTGDTLQRITGQRPLYFRPPYGAFNSNVLKYANENGLTTFIWNIDPRDWSLPGTNAIIARVLGAARNGAIVLMHDGGGDRSQTIAALPTIIKTLQQRGYRFVTLQQLTQDAHKTQTASGPTSSAALLTAQETSLPGCTPLLGALPLRASRSEDTKVSTLLRGPIRRVAVVRAFSGRPGIRPGSGRAFAQALPAHPV